MFVKFEYIRIKIKNTELVIAYSISFYCISFTSFQVWLFIWFFLLFFFFNFKIPHVFGWGTCCIYRRHRLQRLTIRLQLKVYWKERKMKKWKKYNSSNKNKLIFNQSVVLRFKIALINAIWYEVWIWIVTEFDFFFLHEFSIKKKKQLKLKFQKLKTSTISLKSDNFNINQMN